MRTRKDKIMHVILWIIVIITLLFLLVPIYYMISSSFKTQRQMMNIKQLFIWEPTIKFYKNIFLKHDITTPLINSIIVSLGATGLACILGLPAAYSIARHNMHKLSSVILCVRIVPAVTFLVPWYMILSKWGMLGTRTALILANLLVTLPLIIWIVSPYFGSIPKDLEDAAFIDGCNEVNSFFRIMLPLSGPGIITAAILAFINTWNNFMFPYVLGGSTAQTLTVALKRFIGYQALDYSTLMAAAVVVAMPVVLISIFLQKYVVRGLTAGAVKG